MQPNNGQPQNSGSFMAPAGPPGVGPALSRAMADMKQGGVLNQNSQNPNAVMPAQPPQGGQPIPRGMTTSPSGAGTNMPVAPGDPEIQIALRALAGYIASHSKVKEAQAGVR